jgi:hypothetical protein
MSALPPIADIRLARSKSPLSARTGHSAFTQVKARLPSQSSQIDERPSRPTTISRSAKSIRRAEGNGRRTQGLHHSHL